MILTVTDFGVGSPYLAQMRAALYNAGAECDIIDLVADLAPYHIQAAAHFIASQLNCFPVGALFLGVVDPGVGGDRKPIALKADGRWFVGPDNGLFDVVAARALNLEQYSISWKPSHLSATFHGRDLFAPVAAKIVSGRLETGMLLEEPLQSDADCSVDYPAVIYLDRYGNAISGVRAAQVQRHDRFKVGAVVLEAAHTFSDLPIGSPFWYSNSVGLVEVAINQGSAAQQLNLSVGDPLIRLPRDQLL